MLISMLILKRTVSEFGMQPSGLKRRGLCGEGKKRHIFQSDMFTAWRAWKEHLEITGSKD